MASKRLIRLSLMLIILLMLLMFLTKSASEEQRGSSAPTHPKAKDAVVLLMKDNPELSSALIVGDPEAPAVSPKSVCLQKLLDNQEFYRMAENFKKHGWLAKELIYKTRAFESVVKTLRSYAEKNGLRFIFEQEALFSALSREPEFKDRSKEQLIKLFDITDRVIAFARQEKNRIKSDKGLKKEMEKEIFFLEPRPYEFK